MIISFTGQSGVGKSSLIQSLVDSNNQFVLLPSTTTRTPRANEKNGIDYEFIDKAQWLSSGEGAWSLATEFQDNYYGFRRETIHNSMHNNQYFLLNIDEKGAKELRKHDHDCINILVLPPNLKTIHERLRNRGEPLDSKRFSEIHQWDLDWYHFVAINDNFEQCCFELSNFIKNFKK